MTSLLPQLPKSLADYARSLDPEELEAYLSRLAPTLKERSTLLYQWDFWGRPDQFAPTGSWDTWLIQSGRGWGKTRTGAEWINAQVQSGHAKRIALVGRTAADVRDVMIRGESGILAISPPWNRPVYQPSKRLLTWPNGAEALAFSAEKPEGLRGPQFDDAWCDELAAWKYPDAWDQLQYGLRLGQDPRVVVTTTPRPIKIIRELIADPTTRVTRGSTYDNASNLAKRFLSKLLAKYEGTRLGRQEIRGEILEDTPGALWRRAFFENRLRLGQTPPAMRRIVVAVDPAVSNSADSDETGIVVVGLGVDDLGYVLDDVSGHYTPGEWGLKVLEAYDTWKADRVIAEVNNGGQLVEANIIATARAKQRPSPAYKAVHASRGKQTRAEPISTLYEQGKVRHVGAHPTLEDQCCTWSPAEDDKSPDRLDALVWGLTELMVKAATSDATVLRVRSSR